MSIRTFLKRASTFVLIAAMLLLMAGCDNSTSNGNAGNNGNSLSDNQGAGGNDNSTAINPSANNNDSNAVNNQNGSVNNSSTDNQPSSDTPVEYGMGFSADVKIIVSGNEYNWIERDNFPAVIINGVVLVPDSSGIFENLTKADGNTTGFWTVHASNSDGTSKTTIIANDEYEVRVLEGENFLTVNGETIPLTVPAQTIALAKPYKALGITLNDVFMIPLIAIAEAIDATVVPDEAAGTISISYK